MDIFAQLVPDLKSDFYTYKVVSDAANFNGSSDEIRQDNPSHFGKAEQDSRCRNAELVSKQEASKYLPIQLNMLDATILSPEDSDQQQQWLNNTEFQREKVEESLQTRQIA